MTFTCLGTFNPAYKQSIIDFIDDFEQGKTEFILNTSGSTGFPKSISILREQMILSAKNTNEVLGLKSSDKVLICLNTNFIAGKMMIVRCLIGKMDAYIVEASSEPLKYIENGTQLDFAAFVPYQMNLLLKEPSPLNLNILNGMRCILLGGEPVNKTLEKRLESLKVPVYQTFGMTETVSHFALRKLNGIDKSDFYTTLTNVEIDTDNRGCLIVKSPVTLDQWVKTNDLVDILTSNTFLWKGRSDRVINSGGIKINLNEIDAIIEEVFIEQGIKNNFFSFGGTDEALNERLCLIIEGDKFSKSFEEYINTMVENKMEDKYKAIRSIYYLDTFEKTDTGKTDKLKTINKVFFLPVFKRLGHYKTSI